MSICQSMGIFMVLFYMWCAATPVDTQYFLGFYVLLTYVLILIHYPLTSHAPGKIKYFIDCSIPFTTILVAVYFLMHFLLGAKGPEEPFVRLNWFYGVVALVVAVSFFLPIKYWGKTRVGAPNALDLALALVAIFVVGYFIMEYEDINYPRRRRRYCGTGSRVVQ